MFTAACQCHIRLIHLYISLLMLLCARSTFAFSSLFRAKSKHNKLLESLTGPSNVRRLLATVSSSDPIKRYELKGTGRNSLVEMETNTGHSLKTDVPKKMGGSDVAPQPVETLLAALIGCTQATSMFVGRNMAPRILIDKMEFDLRAERDERGALTMPIEETPEIPARLQRIQGIIRVFATSPLSKSELNILSEQTEARCPVASMVIASGCDMDVEWVDGNSQ
jgi:putative redox protein